MAGSLSLRGGDGKKTNSFGSGEGTTGGLCDSGEGLLDEGGGVGFVGNRLGPRSSSN